jgi:hypothetical protein
LSLHDAIGMRRKRKLYGCHLRPTGIAEDRKSG